MTISYVSGADTTLRDADINTKILKLKLSDRVNSRERGGVKNTLKGTMFQSGPLSDTFITPTQTRKFPRFLPYPPLVKMKQKIQYSKVTL